MEVVEYQEAIPFETAVWVGAPRRLREQWGETWRAQKQWWDDVRDPRKIPEKPDGFAALIMDFCENVALPGLDLWSRRGEIETAMCDCLCAAVRSGKWVAMGYERPRKAGNWPVKIPRDVFDTPDLDRVTSAVSGAGMDFVSVRFTRAKDYALLRNAAVLQIGHSGSQASAADSVVKKKGRPGVKDIISHAYKALKAVDQIDFDAPLKGANMDKINAFITEGGFWKKELSYEAIRTHAGEDFKADKRNR